MTSNSRRKIGNNVKIDIINDVEIKKMKKVDVSKKHRIPCSTISTILYFLMENYPKILKNKQS